MIHAQDTKFVTLIALASVATNATAAGSVDCSGYSYAEIYLQLGTQTAANVDTTMTVTEGDSSTFVTNTDLTMTTVAPDTSNNQTYKWHLDLRKRKKNLKLTYEAVGAARLATGFIILSRAAIVPTTASGRGVTAQVVA